jgi:hypothetical protein
MISDDAVEQHTSGHQHSKYLMSGAVCPRFYESNVEDSTSKEDMESASEQIHVESKKAHERDWKELRQRLERKIAAAAAQAIATKIEIGDGDRRKQIWPLGNTTPRKSNEVDLYQVQSADKITARAPNPRTGVVSPSNRTDSSQGSGNPRPRASQKWKMNGDQWISVDVNQSPSPQSSPLGYKLAKSVSSSGSGTTDVSSEDWEDKFVVNMPSAKDPNPPSMTVQQIRRYQERVGKNHTSRPKRHEMDSGSKWRNGSPEEKKPSPSSNTSIPRLQKATTTVTFKATQNTTVSQSNNGSHQYFSPEEIGQVRVSSIRDDPKVSPKDLYTKLREECFIGCIDMNQISAKNPDEILLFPNIDDDNESKKTVGKPNCLRKFSGADKEKVLASLQSSKFAQDAKQRIATEPHKAQPPLTQRMRTMTIPPSLAAAQPTKIPKPAAMAKENLVQQSNRKDEDDVFIVTPAITHVVVPTPMFKDVIQPSRTRQQKATAIPQAATFYSRTSSNTSPKSVSPVNKENIYYQDSRSKSISPDFVTNTTPTSHQGKHFNITPDSYLTPPPSNGDKSKITTGDIFKHVPGASPQLHEILSPSEERARNEMRTRRCNTNTPGVAELDGLQVNQLPSPPLTASPSPPAESNDRENPFDLHEIAGPKSPGKRDTEAIRREIRKKAEKARREVAEARKDAERLAAARKHAERLAEARAAYERAKVQRAAKKTPPPTKTSLDKLREQKLAAEKLAEAQAAFRAEEAKKKKAAQKNAPSPAPTPSSPPMQPKAVPQPRVDEDNDDTMSLGGVSSIVGMPDFSVSFGAFIMSLTDFRGLLRQHKIFQHIIFLSERLFDMATHSYRVTVHVTEIWSEYRRNDALPDCVREDWLGLACDVGQALVEFVVLGLVIVVTIRAAGYAMFVAGWIVWFVKPLRWLFGQLIGGGGSLFS